MIKRDDCCFLRSGRCTILTKTACEGCSFFKTALRYRTEAEHSERVLAARGLRRCKDGERITVQSIDSDEEEGCNVTKS